MQKRLPTRVSSAEFPSFHCIRLTQYERDTVANALREEVKVGYSVEGTGNWASGSEGRTMGEHIAVRPEDSFEHWHQVTCRRFSRTESRAPTGGHFRANVSIRDFGDLVLNDIWSVASGETLVQVVRRSSDIRADQRDCFMYWLMLDGSAGLEQNGRCLTLRSGDMVLQDQARPFTLDFGPTCHAVMVTIPRPLLETRSHGLGRFAAHKISSDARMAPMASAILRQAFELAAAPMGELDRQIGASVLDLLAATLDSANGHLTASSRSERRLDEVKDYMRARLEDSGLDVEQIAHDRSMSERTLYRLFAMEATTPIQWLWAQRLDTAYRLLSDRTYLRVTDVALQCGFSDLSHFSKAFRTRFGRAPSSMRDS